ncbi:hypothetical protein K504DRAFT_284661 [Pleomassaria siparia CBS 279.74]|uniref:Uncharacterized protein n=1 Tax=Pleomassaria siparia CBS 279.74 TaxID=1314801 RepID=A0A6G1K7F4_9PLEO|nr:hypothetical protein K504DRAFT_284661 [Pleomassaria siparia CBS 279.74]
MSSGQGRSPTNSGHPLSWSKLSYVSRTDLSLYLCKGCTSTRVLTQHTAHCLLSTVYCTVYNPAVAVCFWTLCSHVVNMFD